MASLILLPVVHNDVGGTRGRQLEIAADQEGGVGGHVDEIGSSGKDECLPQCVG